MKNITKSLGLYIALGLSVLSSACSQTGKNFPGPQGYNMNSPQKIIMPESLHEISGIAFYKGNPDTIYAEQDEEGKLFYLKPGDKRAEHFKFGKHGDYEDVAISNEYVILLRSNGTLFSFPFSDIRTTNVDNIKEWKGLLPAGEYEGLYADEKGSLLYVLCKHCSDEKTSKTAEGYILQVAADGTISQNSSFAFSVQDIESMTDTKKLNFHPSALSRNPRTNEWYIVSSVNKLLVVADSSWKVKEVYKLNPALFIQPEGITFDKDANMYISNEGGDIHAGNVLKIRYTGGK